MQGYRILEESILYKAGKHNCELIFFRCNEAHKRYPIYDLELMIDGVEYLDLYEQTANEVQLTFGVLGLRQIISATTEVLDDWCSRHPSTFISFFDCLSNCDLWKIYLKFGFISDGRGETFVAFVNELGQKTAFKGMLNLWAEDDFWINDMWRVAKDFDYYLGDIFTPIDCLRKILFDD